jgi:tmRNA-binding protein
MARPKEPAGRKVIYRNKKAFHDYFIEDRIEAGLVLVGTEVKSLREGRVSLQDAYAAIEDGEAHILNMHISEWPMATHFNHEPDRPRKLLLHAQQIRPFRSTSPRRTAPRSSWGWRGASGSTTSAKPSASAMRSGKPTGNEGDKP